MAAKERIVNIEPQSEVAKFLNTVGDDGVVAILSGHRFRILRENEDPFEQYDPALVRESIARGFGGFRGIDPEELISELRSLRGQAEYDRADE